MVRSTWCLLRILELVDGLCFCAVCPLLSAVRSLCFIERRRQQAIVGADEGGKGGVQGKGAALTPDAGVDDGEVDRVGRKVRDDGAKEVGGLPDGARADGMADIDDGRGGGKAEDDAAHGGDIAIFHTKIGG